MGFGFNLFCAFCVLPLTVVLLMAGAATGKSMYVKLVGFLWLGLLGLVGAVALIRPFLKAGLLTKNDFYGAYVIDRTHFPGKQADWQYNSFRFEIQENDSIRFYVTNREKITKVYAGTSTTVQPAGSARLVLQMPQPTHHIVADTPTVYRTRHGFYVVFTSPKFGNVFFKKGPWKSLAE